MKLLADRKDMRLVLNSLLVFIRSMGWKYYVASSKGISGYGMKQTEEEMKEICSYPT